MAGKCPWGGNSDAAKRDRSGHVVLCRRQEIHQLRGGVCIPRQGILDDVVQAARRIQVGCGDPVTAARLYRGSSVPGIY